VALIDRVRYKYWLHRGDTDPWVFLLIRKGPRGVWRELTQAPVTPPSHLGYSRVARGALARSRCGDRPSMEDAFASRFVELGHVGGADHFHRGGVHGHTHRPGSHLDTRSSASSKEVVQVDDAITDGLASDGVADESL
jgi:hypothetical protein